MGFNELEEARKKRAERKEAEAAKAARGQIKRGRKRKSIGDTEQSRAKMTGQSSTQFEDQVALAWRAPEARMMHNQSV